MLNQIYIHYINTLFVLESFIISCWLLKGKKIGIGIGIGQFARKKSVSESATKNHDRCITKKYRIIFQRPSANYGYLGSPNEGFKPKKIVCVLMKYTFTFSRHFYPKRRIVHSGYNYYFLSVCVFPGNWTHNLCAANAVLFHWATGTQN